MPEVALATSTSGFYLGSPYYSYRKALPDERKWQIGDTLYYSRGNHSFKFGVDTVHNYDLINNTYESNGEYSYTYLGNYLNDLLNKGNPDRSRWSTWPAPPRAHCRRCRQGCSGCNRCRAAGSRRSAPAHTGKAAHC